MTIGVKNLLFLAKTIKPLENPLKTEVLRKNFQPS